MTDEPDTAELENRIETLESTIEKMLPGRRDALKMGGAALAGGSLMAGTASADTVDEQVGTIGGPNEEVDLVSEDIDNSNQITTKDLVVTDTATGPFGGGGVVLEAGDTITVAEFTATTLDRQFELLYSGAAKDVVGGVINGFRRIDFLYEFSDNSTITQNGGVGATTYTEAGQSIGEDQSADNYEVNILPPAKDVIRIEFGHNNQGSNRVGASVVLKD
jgi:hypothetical protein